MKLCPNCQTKYPDDANFCPQESCATDDGPQRLQVIPEAPASRFQPSDRLGGGNTGDVFRARDSQSGAEVAYKLVSPQALPTPAALSRAEREFKQLARVQSSKIAAILDCGKAPQDDRLYVAMELCSGDSLDMILRQGPIAFDTAKSIVTQVGQALLEAQKAGIVHRDVSPKNVIVSPAGDVKVINFPLAVPISDKVSGVAAYVSPEQAQGKPVDQRSNTYSLACVFYHLLTGEPPFTGATPQAVLDLHVSSPPLPPSQRRAEAGLSPEVDRVVCKALDKSSSRRHLTLRLFLTEVEALQLAAPAAESSAGNGKEAGFARTMLFAGGQAEVANLVQKAIAARAAGGAPSPEATIPAPAPAPTAAAPAPTPPPVVVAFEPPSGMANTVAVASTMVAGTIGSAPARLTPPPDAAPRPIVVAPPTPAKVAPVKVPVGSQAPAAQQVAPGGQGSAFRETLWFKKGEVDQMVAEAKAKMVAQGKNASQMDVPEDNRPIEDRYIDDGSVSTEDRKKFSLRTGGTATAMPVARGQRLPGESMSESDVMSEIGGGRKTMILVIAGVVLAAVIVVVVMMTRGKGGATSEAPPAPVPAAAAAPPKPTVAATPTPPPAPVKAAAPAPEPAKKKSGSRRASRRQR